MTANIMPAPRRIGLALSGGVARGPAHVGVLLALERAEIPIDVVSGTSAGALAGALYCAGITPARMLEVMEQVGWRQFARPVFPRRGFVSFDKLERWLSEKISGATFEGLHKPLAVVATDLESGAPYVMRSGQVARAVHASCAVPGVVVPVMVDGHSLCDGGASCNLPVAQARALGADYVIGVDLAAHAQRRHWGPLGVALGALEILVRRSGGGLEDADCLIVPALAGTSYINFRRAHEYIALGERAAEQQLPAIRAALGARGPAMAARYSALDPKPNGSGSLA